MGVSKNSGTPKSSILIGCSIINHPFWGTPYICKKGSFHSTKAVAPRWGTHGKTQTRNSRYLRLFTRIISTATEAGNQKRLQIWKYSIVQSIFPLSIPLVNPARLYAKFVLKGLSEDWEQMTSDDDCNSLVTNTIQRSTGQAMNWEQDSKTSWFLAFREVFPSFQDPGEFGNCMWYLHICNLPKQFPICCFHSATFAAGTANCLGILTT